MKFSERKIFRNEIIIRRGVKNVQSQFEEIDSLSVGHDTLFLYSKNSELKLPKLQNYSEEDEPGKWDTFWRGTDRPTMRYELLGQTPADGQWRWQKIRALEAIANYQEYLSDYQKRMSLDEFYHLKTQELGTDADFLRLNDEGVVQYYVSPRNYKLMSDVWMKIVTAGKETNFSHEKNIELITKAIGWIASKSAIVLDSFAGSGSTAHAVLTLNKNDNGNRKFILVEMEDYAETLTAKRVKDAINKQTNAKMELSFQSKPGVTYCTLGPPIELDKILTGEALPSYEALGQVLYHMAVNRTLEASAIRQSDFHLGEHGNQHVWLIYKPELEWLKGPDAALTLSFARKLAADYPGKDHLVFAASRFVSEKLLGEEGLRVEFVPLPFALYRIEKV